MSCQLVGNYFESTFGTLYKKFQKHLFIINIQSHMFIILYLLYFVYNVEMFVKYNNKKRFYISLFTFNNLICGISKSMTIYIMMLIYLTHLFISSHNIQQKNKKRLLEYVITNEIILDIYESITLTMYLTETVIIEQCKKKLPLFEKFVKKENLIKYRKILNV